MTPVFLVKTTDLLTPEERAGLARLFEKVFHKPCPVDVFERKFSGNCVGRSIHSLMYVDDRIVGAFSAIPVRFRFFGRELLFANTADLMITPEHRGNIGRVKCLADGLYSGLAGEGVAFVFCCLRDEIFGLHKAVSKWRAIGKVHYYIAPFFGPASMLVRLWNRFSSSAHANAFPIAKVNDSQFTGYRYRIFPADYRTLELPSGGTAVYLTEPYHKIAGIPNYIRLALLADVFPLTEPNFDNAVNLIHEREPRVNLLVYQGFLPFQPRRMVRVPAKFEKQPWTLAGLILKPDEVDDRVFDLANWNVNLSNGDLI